MVPDLDLLMDRGGRDWDGMLGEFDGDADMRSSSLRSSSSALRLRPGFDDAGNGTVSMSAILDFEMAIRGSRLEAPCLVNS